MAASLKTYQSSRSQHSTNSYNSLSSISTSILSSNRSNFVNVCDSDSKNRKDNDSVDTAPYDEESERNLDDQISNNHSVSNLDVHPTYNISRKLSNITPITSVDQLYILPHNNEIDQIAMEDTYKLKDNIIKDLAFNADDNDLSDSDSDNDEEKEFEMIIYDPSVFKPLPTQIAGHGSEGDGEKGFLKRPDGRLLKPVQAPPRGLRERDFYKRINTSKDPTDLRLKKFIPEFFGVEKVGFINGITVTEEFLILRDITEGFSRPSIMDIKIGSRTWGPDASAKKQAQENAKYAGTKHPFGFR